jgi:CubicO group peptidase (beta-lactamase class C family)
MTRYCALLAASLGFCALTSSAAEPRPADWIRRLDGSRISIQEADSFARKTLEAAHVTGAQLVVLDGGRLVWSAAYGLRRREPELPMERETTTWAASMTKSVFATYVMQLVERGEFNLDEPVARQLQRPLNEYEPFLAIQ